MPLLSEKVTSEQRQGGGGEGQPCRYLGVLQAEGTTNAEDLRQEHASMGKEQQGGQHGWYDVLD